MGLGGGFGAARGSRAAEGLGQLQAEHVVERAEDAADRGRGGDQGLEVGILQQTLDIVARVGGGAGLGGGGGDEADQPGELVG